MRKLSYLVLILALAMPLALPFAPALAQDDGAVKTRLEEYNANLPPAYGNISVDDLAIEMLEKPDLLLLDVSTPEEYEDGHIMGAVNVPLRELGKNLALLPDADAEIVTICGSGFRSAIAMTSLQILGYTDVRNMRGGMRAWAGAEYETTTDAVVPAEGTAPDFDEAVVAGVDAQLSALPDGWGGISPDALDLKLVEAPPAMLIDVRSPGEWDELGYIAGAELMPLESLMDFAGEWPEDKDASIVVYCAVGHRGNMAATIIRTMGYTNVLNLSSGFNGWATAGLPVEGGAGDAADAAELDVEALLADYVVNLPVTFNAIRADDLSIELAEKPDLLLVDVRTPDEFVDGHLAGAVNVPLNELTAHLDMMPDQDQEIVVYCGSGHRSAMAMVILNLLGYENTRSLLGGVQAWGAADLPVTTDVTEYEGGAAPEVDPLVFELADNYVQNIPAGYYSISADALNTALVEEPPFLIDVRTPPELENGYIPGAVHIELRTFMENMDQWPDDKAETVVLYCGSDHRAVVAMVAMQLMGYEDVTSLAGGLQAWLANEYPVTTEAIAN